MEEYVVFTTNLIPKKRQLPDIHYLYLVGGLHNPECTDDLDHATIFTDEQEARMIAENLCMEFGKIKKVVEKIY